MIVSLALSLQNIARNPFSDLEKKIFFESGSE